MPNNGSIFSKIVFALKLLSNKRILTSLADTKMRNMILALKNGRIFAYNPKKFPPDKLAIIEGKKRITYGELHDRISRLNGGLLSLGLSVGDRIAIIAGNSSEFLETALGTTFIGVKTIPVNWHLKKNEIEYVINNSGAIVLVVAEQFLETIIAIQSKLKKVKKVIVIGDNVPDGMISYKKLLNESSPYQKKSRSGGGLTFYTSGTTGRPKGASSRALEDITILTPDDVADLLLLVTNFFFGFNWDKTTNIHLASAPLYHGAPLGFCGITLYYSGTVVIMEKFEAEKAMQLIENEKISTTYMPPILLRRMIYSSGKESHDVSSMKSIICAAAPCPVELKKEIVKFFGPVFYETYSSTDGAANTILKPEHYLSDPDKFRSVGKMTQGNNIIIVDENNVELPVNTTGDMLISNAMVKYLNYHNEPEKTKNSFVEIRGEKYFKEGEIAWLDEDQFCYIADRKKDMIISGGVNIYPAEIEEILLLYPGIMDAAVIGIPDEEWGETVKAVVVLKKGCEPSEEDIIAFCRENLAGYKRPKSVDFVDDLPRHPTGKLLKRLLKEKYTPNVV